MIDRARASEKIFSYFRTQLHRPLVHTEIAKIEKDGRRNVGKCPNEYK